MAPEKIWFVLADDGETWLGPYEQPEFQEGEWRSYVRSDVAEQRIEVLEQKLSEKDDYWRGVVAAYEQNAREYQAEIRTLRNAATDGLCEHGNDLNGYCEPCGRIHGG